MELLHGNLYIIFRRNVPGFSVFSVFRYSVLGCRMRYLISLSLYLPTPSSFPSLYSPSLPSLPHRLSPIYLSSSVRLPLRPSLAPSICLSPSHPPPLPPFSPSLSLIFLHHISVPSLSLFSNPLSYLSLAVSAFKNMPIMKN